MKTVTGAPRGGASSESPTSDKVKSVLPGILTGSPSSSRTVSGFGQRGGNAGSANACQPQQTTNHTAASTTTTHERN